MRHTSKLFVLIVAVTLILSLSGCNLLKKPATPPLQTLEPEDSTNAMIENADDPVPEETPADADVEDSTEDGAPTDTEGSTEEIVDTDATTDEPADTLSPTPTSVPTIEPSPTAVPVTVDATAEPTTAPTTAPVATDGKHTVQAGENLFRIALKYGLTTDAVAKANNITNPALIYVGQVLTIPSGGTGSPGTTTPNPTGKTHVVQAGENLFRIALKYGLDQYYLASYNGITNPALIYVGQVLQIP